MFGRKRKLDDFTSEIEAHIQLEIERLREQGLSEASYIPARRATKVDPMFALREA